MTIYVLALDLEQPSLNRLTAHMGFAARGEEVRLFERDAFDALPLDRDDIVVGGIVLAQKAFARLGIAVPALDPVPESLGAFAQRKTWQTTMAEARRLVQRGDTVFAKPNPDRPKLFNGQLLGSVRDLIATAHIADDEIIDCAEPLHFVSEYRVFVCQGQVLGVRHYKGDPLVFPDDKILRSAVAAHHDAPAGYALDMGVTNAGDTALVEINDGYASAAYGLTPIRYANVIKARWQELAQQKGA